MIRFIQPLKKSAYMVLKRHIFALVLLLILFSASAGCSQSDQSTTQSAQGSGVASAEGPEAGQTEPVPLPTEETAIQSALYPDALGRGEKVYYNDDTLKQYSSTNEKAKIAITVDELKHTSSYYVTDIKTAKKVWVNPASGEKFFLVGVTVSPVGFSETYISPKTSDFALVDGSNTYPPKLEICDEMDAVIQNSRYHDEALNERYGLPYGEVYVVQSFFGSLNKAEGSGPVSGWLIFDVPDTFTISPDTYITLDLGTNVVVWKLFSIMADVSVSKNPITGDIKVLFNGGPEAQVIQSIEVDVIQPGGAKNSDSIPLEPGYSTIPVGSEVTVSGSKPGEGKDHVIMSFVRKDGQTFVKYDGYLGSGASS